MPRLMQYWAAATVEEEEAGGKGIVDGKVKRKKSIKLKKKKTLYRGGGIGGKPM